MISTRHPLASDLVIDFVSPAGRHIGTISQVMGMGVPMADVLNGFKLALSAAIDARAENIRARYVTPGSGQAMEYQEAQVQAFDALAKPSTATPELYPMLAATIGLDTDPSTGEAATDVLGVARAIQVAYQRWGAVGAAVRRARIAGKAAISAAATFDAAAEAYEAVAWPE